jgi:hypothetical protein
VPAPDVQEAAAAGLDDHDVQHASTFLTFHPEMTETKLRFLLQVTLLRSLRRAASAEERALTYLGI